MVLPAGSPTPSEVAAGAGEGDIVSDPAGAVGALTDDELRRLTLAMAGLAAACACPPPGCGLRAVWEAMAGLAAVELSRRRDEIDDLNAKFYGEPDS